MTSMEDAIKENLGVGSGATIQVTPDALVITPAPINPEGDPFTWERVEYRPGEWVKLQKLHNGDGEWLVCQVASWQVPRRASAADIILNLRHPLASTGLTYGDRLQFATWEDYDALMARAMEAHSLAFNPMPQLGGRTKKKDFDRLGQLYPDTPAGALNWKHWKQCENAENGNYFKTVACNSVLNDYRKAAKLSQWLRGRNAS